MRSNLNIAKSNGVSTAQSGKAFVKVAFFLLFFFVSISYSARTVTLSNSWSGRHDNWVLYFNPGVHCRAYCTYGKYAFEYPEATFFSDIDCPWPNETPIRIVASGTASCRDVSGSNSATCEGIWGCAVYPLEGSNNNYTDYGCDFNASGTCSFTLPVDDVIPPCSELLPISAPECKGGEGLSMQTNSPVGSLILSDRFGDLTVTNSVPGSFDFDLESGAQGVANYTHNQTSPFDTLSRPDGSQCISNVQGQMYNWLVCPLGWEEEPEDVCEANPLLPECQQGSSDSNGGNSSGSNCEGEGCSSGSGDDGVSCMDLNNCDWAKVDIQLEELGVAIEIRNKINDIAQLEQNGYNLSQQQYTTLQGILNAVGNGTSNITGAIGNSTTNIAGAIGNSTSDIVGAINNLANGLGGSGGGGTGSGTIAGGVADGFSQFIGDTTGVGDLDGLIDGFGEGSGGNMGDSLGNGAGVREKIRNSVGIKGEDFHFLGTGGNCPVWDLSFNSGIMGIGCSGCRIDLCNVYGFNAGQLIKAIIWLFVLVGTLFMNLQILKTGGRS